MICGLLPRGITTFTDLRSEKHIREVELENALKLYQDALKLHYKGDWDGAFDAYDSLLASDVLQDVLHKVSLSHESN